MDFFREISEIGSARCSEIHRGLTYHLPFGGIFTGLRINETKLFSTKIGGFIDRQGNCKATLFA